MSTYSNYSSHYPAGADAALARRERAQEKAEDRIRQIRQRYMCMPSHEVVSAYPGDHMLRLERIVQIMADAEQKRITSSEAAIKLRSEYLAIVTEATEWKAEQEGLL